MFSNNPWTNALANQQQALQNQYEYMQRSVGVLGGYQQSPDTIKENKIVNKTKLLLLIENENEE
jgi:hypothetical protein